MQLARIIGNVVSTRKDENLVALTLLVLQPLAADGSAFGRTLVAVDATCARVIGLDPWKIPYLEKAGRFLGNLESERIQHRGESPSRYATTFDVVDHFKKIRLERT